MSHSYHIYLVDPDLAEGREIMGSKKKFWFRRSDSGERWLFKYSRNTGSSASDAVEYCGEHWAEKIAAEIAATLGISHADVQLARHESMPGAIVRDFAEDPRTDELIHGNELLFESDPTYPKAKRRRVREHTIDNVLDALAQHFISLPESSDIPPEIQTPPDLFVGYLLLDVLIGNTDRHHENWGIISRDGEERAVLAPSYDHASSLGRELRDSERTGRLNTRDQRYTVEAYTQRAHSAWFLDAARKQPLSPLDAFCEAGRRRPEAARVWLDSLHGTSVTHLDDIIARVPEEMMSQAARDFSRRLLAYNRGRLLEMELG